MKIQFFKRIQTKYMQHFVFAGIRTLQCILLKVALLLGVEIHANVTYEGLAEPPPPDPAQTESMSTITKIIIFSKDFIKCSDTM